MIAVCYHGKEFLHYNYEVLCCDDESLRWEPSSLGRFHANAIPGGRTAVGETLYIGRAWHNGALTPGKIHSSHKVVYIPYGGLEFGKDTYEILVSQPQPQHQPQPQPQPRNEEVFYNEPAIVERVETTSSQHNEDDSFEMISSENENFPRENYAQCKICLSNEVGVVFTPCGHLLCCVDCASRLTTCPLCRHHIAGMEKSQNALIFY